MVTSTQSAYNSCESVAAVYNPPTPPYIFLIGKLFSNASRLKAVYGHSFSNLLNGVAATMDTKAAPDLPSISCYIHQCVSAFLNWFNVLQSIVLHVYIFVSQE